jgi:hypothetical protein
VASKRLTGLREGKCHALLLRPYYHSFSFGTPSTLEALE